MLLLIFGADLLAGIPSPRSARSLRRVGGQTDRRREIRHLWQPSKVETAVAATCFAGAAHRPLAGIVLAFVLSLINLLRKAARPAVDVLEGSDDPHVSLTVSDDGVGETVPG